MKRPSQDLVLTGLASSLARAGNGDAETALLEYERTLEVVGVACYDPLLCQEAHRAEIALRAIVGAVQFSKGRMQHEVDRQPVRLEKALSAFGRP